MGRKIIPVPYTLLINIFIIEGFSVVRKRGDHIIMTKPGVKRPLVIKSSPKRVPVMHIRTNMRTAGMNRERYFQLLDKVK